MCEICRSNPCRPQCPNFNDEPLTYCYHCDKGIYADDIYYEINDIILCEDCISNYKHTATRSEEITYNGAPVISYGDKWED